MMMSEADRVVGRLQSSDPDFNDCSDAVAVINQLRAELAALKAGQGDAVACEHKKQHWNLQGGGHCDDCGMPVGTSKAKPATGVIVPRELLDWAVERWHLEVSQRPLVNVHRRSLDDTWRQVIRKLEGDPIILCGPDHDALLAQQEVKS